MLSDALQARPPERGGTADAVRPAGETLQARVREIVRGSPTPEEALEPALRAILEGTGASAGAICFYDPRAEVLRLTAESGLSDEGCRRLRRVRRGDSLSWDMPLQSLFSRRAYLIESASKNRYVPPLVEQAASVRTIACLPLYAGATALGSLVIVCLAPQAFTERHIRVLELPLREIIRLIETVRQRPAIGAPASAPVSRLAPAPPLPRGPDVQRVQAALQTAEAMVTERDLDLAAAQARIAELENAAAATRERIAQLEADGTATREQLVKLVDEGKVRVRAVEAELATRMDDLEAVRRERAAVETARVLAAEEELIRARERIAALEAEAAAVPERVSETVRDAEARVRAIAADLEARTAELTTRTAERDARTAELEASNAELEALRHECAEGEGAEVIKSVFVPAGPSTAAEEPAAVMDAADPSPPAEAEPEAPLVVEVHAEPPVAVAAPTPERHDAQTVVVVDADPWEGLAVNGHRVLVRRPEDVAGAYAGKLIANLAVAGVIDGLVGLRSSGCDGKIWACVADPANGRALPLGPIEPAGRPFDLDAVLASLSTKVARGARVVTVGADVDVLVSLRQALARQGISVSMAWDGKQADDLLAMVRPQLVVLDLGLPQNEGYRILARLAAAENVPTALVVAGEDDAAGFAALLNDPMHAQLLVPLDKLVGNVLARRDRPAPTPAA